ncbi:hypothetical protein P3T35_005575 [Kitasatospora sp. GP30]|jgi:hypothetical protein|nr:hypothetical protein [Kitasatospora sp. GP30]
MTAVLSVAGHRCGCPQPCDGRRCRLEALVRPRFFCGQLLTDQDLSGLASWVLDRRRLGRYRDGWGVVTGLDVGLDPTPGASAATVVVQPGYAVSSCGEDVVVGRATTLDLAAYCPDPTSPCGTPSGPPPTECVLDIGIAYREVGEDPVAALGTAGCSQAGECENSRIVESFALRCVPVVDGTEPDRPDWRQWQHAYADAVAVLHQAQAAGLPGNADSAGLKSWLSARLRERPLRHFPFVADQVGGSGTVDAGQFTELLFWIAQDRILSLLDGSSPPGCPGEAVPLARVWLAAEDDAQQVRHWVVKAIDPVSPYRRDFGPVRWPAPFGLLNLGQVVWHRLEEAELVLRDLGVPAGEVAQWQPSTVDDLIAVIGRPPVVGVDVPVNLAYFVPSQPQTHLTGRRIVGFQAVNAKPAPSTSAAATQAPALAQPQLSTMAQAQVPTMAQAQVPVTEATTAPAQTQAQAPAQPQAQAPTSAQAQLPEMARAQVPVADPAPAAPPAPVPPEPSQPPAPGSS